jgi:hypothetical protein
MEEDGAYRADSTWHWRHVWSVLGVLALLAWLPFYAFISLIAPSWVVVPAMAVWLGFLVLAVRWFKPYPLRVLAIGLGAVALWYVVGFLGEVAFGWTA